MSDPASSSTPSSTPKHHEHQPPPRRRRPHESHLSSLIRWLQLKNYQYEVTFSLYMLTSTEKCIFSAPPLFNWSHVSLSLSRPLRGTLSLAHGRRPMSQLTR